MKSHKVFFSFNLIIAITAIR